MAIESATDRLTFLDTDDFGVEATYTPSGGVGTDLTGIYDGPTVQRDFGEAISMIGAHPTFLCRTADVPAGAAGGDAGDTLTIGAVTWRVTDLQPDSQGMTLIGLAA